MNSLEIITPDYIYVTIPAEYICIYYRILKLLADYGLETIKDCKAGCSDKNTCAIECFNMFNSAVACKKLGKEKEAALIIKYIKAKLDQLNNSKANFVFPTDKHHKHKVFVTDKEIPTFGVTSTTLEALSNIKRNNLIFHDIDNNKI